MTESYDQHAELQRLHAAMTGSKAASAAWRELLIESLGDRMCGSGAGPTQDEIDTLASLEEEQQRASEDYMVFLASVSLSEIDRGMAAMKRRSTWAARTCRSASGQQQSQ